ncbi:MAG: glycosyltransferase [Candidatus ainarchaeum sp.]|nr:glycosyltransferase [Candidatus ainarchaeum sp.]
MRILFITERYPPFVVSGNRIYYISKYFSNNHDVFVFTRKNDRLLKNYPKDDYLYTDFVNKIYFNVQDNILLSLLNKIKILNRNSFYYMSGKKEIIKNENLFKHFDLIIASGPTWDAFYLAEYLLDKYNTPYILDYRDPWITKSKIEKQSQKRILEKAKAVITVTKECADVIKLETKYDGDIKIIENGVDLNYFKIKKKNKEEKKLKIGYAGSFLKYQEVDKLLSAINLLPKKIKKETEFFACGQRYKKYKLLATKLNINSNFFGFVPFDKTNEILSDCDLLYIGNSIYNAVGGKFYIYLGLNKPVLAYTVKGSSLYNEIAEKNLGFVGLSVLELSNILKEVYKNKDLLNKNRIKKYIFKYDWKELSKKYENIIIK